MSGTADHLAEIPDLAAEAWATRGTRAITGETAGARTVPGSRCLADLDRLVALDPDHADGLGVLSTWVRAVSDEMTEAGWAHDWPADTVKAACAWLKAALPWCEGRGFEDELADDVRRLWGSLRHICMVRAEYSPRCRHCMDHVDLVDADRRPATPESFAYGLCRGCGETYPKGPALSALGQLQDFTLAELSGRVKVALGTLHDWSRKGWITPTTEAVVKRDRLYSLDGVLRVRDRLRGANDTDAISA